MRAPPPEGARAFARARASDGNDLRTVWPSGLRRWLQAPVRKGVGSNPTAVILIGVLGDDAMRACCAGGF